MNIEKIESKILGKHKPLRTVIPVGKLYFGQLIEN